MVKQIIKEAMEKNPIGLKEAVEAELRARVTLALEAKMKKEDEHEDDEELEEAFKPGDSVSYEDEYGKKVTGKYHRYLGKNKGHVKIAGGTDVNVHHSRLNNESFDLSDYTVEELEDFMMSEDFDQLDELDKKTLASYVKKAVDSKSDAEDTRDYRTAVKRRRGIVKAIDKLAK